MNRIIKIFISIILIIIFWISWYFWVWKILEIKKKWVEKQEIKKLFENTKKSFPSKEEIKKYYEKQKQEKIEAELKRLSATIVTNSKECKVKSNSSLWQNKHYWFKICIPQDYLWYSEFMGRFSGDIFDETIGIWLEKHNDRNDWYFSSIWINAYEKPYRVEKKSENYVFETKTHIIEFIYDKKNKEHIEAIKSLKLYDKNKKIILDKEFLDKIHKNDFETNFLINN